MMLFAIILSSCTILRDHIALATACSSGEGELGVACSVLDGADMAISSFYYGGSAGVCPDPLKASISGIFRATTNARYEEGADSYS